MSVTSSVDFDVTYNALGEEIYLLDGVGRLLWIDIKVEAVTQAAWWDSMMMVYRQRRR